MSISESKAKPKKSFLERLGIFLEFEGPKRKNIDDPKHKLRRLFAEILGTFFLVLVAVGENIVYLMNAGAISPIAIVVAPGLMVMTIILFMGNVSGAHLNPVVSIAFAASRSFA